MIDFTRHFGSRSIGKTVADTERMIVTLIDGKPFGVMSHIEDDYAERLQRTAKDRFHVNVEYQRVTRKEPDSPIQLRYDKTGEVCGRQFVDQTDVFVGWKFTLKALKNENIQ